MNAEFTLSADVLAAADHLPIISYLSHSKPPKGQNHLEGIPRAATRRMKGLRGLTYEERLQALKLQPQGKRGLRKDLVLTHKILYDHTNLRATQLFKFSRRPGLRRSSIRLLHQTGKIRRRRNSPIRSFVGTFHIPYQKIHI